MNLIIDAGNTLVKLAIFDKGVLLYHHSTERENVIATVKKIISVYPNLSWAIVSAVSYLDEKDIKALSVFCKVHILDANSKLPFKNLYSTPKTLGVDRIALAAAAFYNKVHSNTLVIDAGTCITYDIINDMGEYLGGAISPGLQMRYKALHNHTSKLPLLTLDVPAGLIGDSTKTSIHSGIVNGVSAEIDGIVDRYQRRFADLTVILTGGDAQFLSKRLKNTIFADSKFLLKGLNFLLEYNKR